MTHKMAINYGILRGYDISRNAPYVLSKFLAKLKAMMNFLLFDTNSKVLAQFIKKNASPKRQLFHRAKTIKVIWPPK